MKWAELIKNWQCRWRGGRTKKMGKERSFGGDLPNWEVHRRRGKRSQEIRGQTQTTLRNIWENHRAKGRKIGQRRQIPKIYAFSRYGNQWSNVVKSSSCFCTYVTSNENLILNLNLMRYDLEFPFLSYVWEICVTLSKSVERTCNDMYTPQKSF